MATTAKGTPYVVSTDLVANYPTVSSDLADHIDDNLAYNAVSINAQTGTTYTFALADASEGKLVTASNAAASTYTVPPQSSVTWAAGAVLRILNQGAGVVTIAAGAGVTINGTPLTLAQYKGAAIQRTASNTWTFIPFSGGVGSAAISDTPTGSYTGYQYWSFTASGTLNVTTAGFADILLISGGGGGGTAGGTSHGAGGGAGGHLEYSNAYLPSGALTVTIGAGGAANINGATTSVRPYYSVGGGAGGHAGLAGGTGGSGGGAYGGGYTGGTSTSLLGNNGGASTFAQNGGGGGGGAGGVGATATTGAGGAGGTGTANSYTGASVTRAGGGGGATSAAGGTGGGGAGGGAGATGTAGTANTGGGGGGGGASGGAGGAGGSGLVIVRVAV